MQTELSGCATEARAARRSCHHDAGPAMWAQMRGVLGREGAGTSSMKGSVKSFVCSSSCHNRCPTQTIEEYVGTTVQFVLVLLSSGCLRCAAALTRCGYSSTGFGLYDCDFHESVYPSKNSNEGVGTGNG